MMIMKPTGDIYSVGMQGVLIAPDPAKAGYYAAGAAVAGGLVGGFLGKHIGWLAGTIGGALSLGFITWFYFSGRGLPSAADLQNLVQTSTSSTPIPGST